MVQENEGKQGKYSLVTGQKIKNKSVRKLKKEHKQTRIQENKEQKKLDKKKRKIEKKLVEPIPTVEAVTISKTNLESSDMKSSINQDLIDNKIVSKEKKQEKILIVRKTENGRPVTKKRKFLNLLSYALVGVVAIFFGYFAGNFYVANVLNKVDYSAFSEELLMATNGQELYESITQGDIEGNSAIDLFVASEYLFNTRDSYKTTIRGEIQPSIGSLQLIWGSKNKTGDVFEIENVSKGMMSIGEKYTYDASTKTALIYKATSIKTNEATYPDSPTWTMDYDAFRAEYGTSPDKPCVPYIISDKTVEGQQWVERQADGTYKISFNLTKDSSVINYVKQVKHMSGLQDYPVFKNIRVTAIINENLEFQTLRFDESYSVMYFGVMATCSGFVEISVSY